MTEVFNDQPDADVIGWCHSCETFQRGHHARLVELPWSPGTLAWCCIHCDDEPWGLGVWDDGRWERIGLGECADALCTVYPLDCAEHRRLPVTGDPPR